jgi:hypothetical protein
MSPGTGGVARFRCPICDSPLVDRIDYINHLRSIHPSYTAWGRKNARNAFAAIVIVTGMVLTSNFLLPGNSWVLLLGVGSFVAVVAITISYTLLIRKRFRGASKGQNTEGTQLNQASYYFRHRQRKPTARLSPPQHRSISSVQMQRQGLWLSQSEMVASGRTSATPRVRTDWSRITDSRPIR